MKINKKIKLLKTLLAEKARQVEPVKLMSEPLHKTEDDRPPGLQGLSVGDLIVLEADGALNQQELGWLRKKSVHWKRTRVLPFM